MCARNHTHPTHWFLSMLRCLCGQEIRGIIFYAVCRCERQWVGLLRSNSFVCGDSRPVFWQCVRIGPCLQFPQGRVCCVRVCEYVNLCDFARVRPYGRVVSCVNDVSKPSFLMIFQNLLFQSLNTEVGNQNDVGQWELSAKIMRSYADML